MSKKGLNVYISGMGGQGIAFLARLIIEACIEAKMRILSCDTHGMAQRGGIVKSHLRIGAEVRTPMIPKGKADLCLGLERLEAMRAVREMSAPQSTALYYDSVYQPASVRTGNADYPENGDFEKLAARKKVTLHRVHISDIPDPKMQNTALLAEIVRLKLMSVREQYRCLLNRLWQGM